MKLINYLQLMNTLGMVVVAVFAWVQWNNWKVSRKDNLYKTRLDCYERVFTFWVASSFELGFVFAGDYIDKTTDEIFKKYENQKNFLLMQADLVFPSETWNFLNNMQTNMESNSPLLKNKTKPENPYDPKALHNHFRSLIKLED